MAVLLTVGMVAAIEISNRLSINVFLPDMQGNVGASSDEISWVIILYNVGYLCSIAMALLDDACHRHQAPLAVKHRDLCHGCDGLRAEYRQSGAAAGFALDYGIRRRRVSGARRHSLRAAVSRESQKWRRSPGFTSFLLRLKFPIRSSWGGSPIRFTGIMPSWLIFPFWRSALFLSGSLSRQGFCSEREKDSRVDVWGALLLIASLACLETATSRGERDLWFQSNWITAGSSGGSDSLHRVSLVGLPPGEPFAGFASAHSGPASGLAHATCW